MRQLIDEVIKRWTARRKSTLVLDIIQGKTTVAEASRKFDVTPSEIEGWVVDAKRGMENALRAKPEDVWEQYGTSGSSRICRKPTSKRCWSCALEKNWRPCWAKTRPDGLDPAETAGRWV